jgi:hypothetical protein
MATLNNAPMFAPIPMWWAAASAFTNQTLSASGNKIGSIFYLPEGATLTDGGFRYGARTGTPPTYRISLQGVDANGVPDGSILASQTFTPPADTTWNSTWQWVTFSASYAAARGSIYALVIDYSSGTIDASNNSSFTRFDAGYASGRPNVPYSVIDTSGSWSKSNTTQNPVYGVKSSSAVYGNPVQSVVSTTVSSSGHRAALKFTLPSGICSTFALNGFRVIADPPATGNTWAAGLWDSAGNVIQAITIDADHQQVDAVQRCIQLFFDDTPVALSPGTDYYIGIERGGSNCIFYSLGLAAANDALAYPLMASGLLSTWNGSAWSDDTTSVPLVELLLSDMTCSGGTTGGFIIGA